MIIIESVPQAVLHHRVGQLEVAHLGAIAHMAGVHGLAHAFLATGDDNGRSTRLNLLHADGDGAQTRAADLVDAPSWRVDWNAGRNRCLTSWPLTLTCGQDLA